MTLSELSPAKDETISCVSDEGRQARATSETKVDVAYDWNLTTDALSWSDGLDQVIDFATPYAFATGLAYAEHLAPDSLSSRYEAVMASGGCDTGSGVPFQVIYGLLPSARSGRPPVWIEDTGRWFADANGRPGLVHGTIHVVTERYEAERALTMAAQRDPATGAFNASHFNDHVARYLTLSGRKHTTFAVLVADFRMTAGGRDLVDPSVVDETLAVVVSRIRQLMRGSEALARLADTRLAMLLENCNGEQMAAASMRLVDMACADAVDTSVGPIAITVRVGGVIAPLYGKTPTAILGFAGEALDVAIRGGEPFVRYEPDMAKTAARQKILQATDEIIAALNEHRVVIALQPIVDAKTREVVFCEALVRIRYHDDTLLMPEVLVPAAEQGGLVALLDRRVVDLAFAHLVEDRSLSLSVNASVTSLHDQQWQEHFRATCALHPGAARRLTVEITETCAVADLEATRAVLLTLKALDVKIAIDDFGSGHSSFRSLRNLPIDYLKIDGAFARNLSESPDDRFFVRTLIDLAKNLRIPTVAEWVEDDMTADTLTDWGIDLLQGHLFGKAEVAIKTPAVIAA